MQSLTRWLFLLFAANAYGQVYAGAGAVIYPGAVMINTSASPSVSITSSSRVVTIAGPSGTSCAYTTDGSFPNMASTPYTGTFSVSAGTTVNAVCANVSKSYYNVQGSSAGWKCVTLAPVPSGCQLGGGVAGVISAASQTYAASGVESASTTQTSAQNVENQILFVNTQTGASGAASFLAEDKIFTVSQGSSYIANNELDMNLNDTVSKGTPTYHAGGLQCNQQSTNPSGNGFAGGPQWQIDNQQGSWINTGITYGCPIQPGITTEARYLLHWFNGDTGCGSGYGCDYYDTLTICVAGACNSFNLGQILSSYTETWGDIMIIQDQLDLTNVTQSGANPTTATRTLTQDNLVAGVFSTMVTGSAYIP